MARGLLRRAGEGTLLGMIHEYALEPELVATWTDPENCRYFKESFGLDRGRIVSRFPKRWKRLVWRAVSSTDDFARKRLEVLLAHLTERMVNRSNIDWQPTATSWLENAETEHDKRPFHAILARANPRRRWEVLTKVDMDESMSRRWSVRRACTVARNAKEMAEKVAPLLRCSSIVIFVDPHFTPSRRRYRRPFETFLERLVQLRPGMSPKRVELQTAAKDPTTDSWFRRECHEKLCACVPSGIRVLVRRLKKKPDGDRLHNRYILSDLGGVTFGIGLDEGNEGETDDVTLMERSQYELRWSQYAGDPPAGFEQSESPIEIVGTKTSLTQL